MGVWRAVQERVNQEHVRLPVEGGPEGSDGALEDRGMGLVEVQVVQPHQLPRPRGLMHSLKNNR